MRNQRNKRVHFKQGKEYTLRRIGVVAGFLLLIFLLASILFHGKETSNENQIGSENSSNTQIEITGQNTTVSNTDGNNTTVSENDNSNNTLDENTIAQYTKPHITEDVTIKMAVTGDIMCHNTMYQDAYNSSTKSYDFSYMFDDILIPLQTADITVGNLETTFAGSKVGYSGYPTFNTPEILATNLKKAGFDVVSTANNHCMDKGYKGIESTINYLDEADLSHTGTFKSEEDQNTILIKNVKNIEIAFLSFTYGTNGIPVPKDKSYAVNLIDKDLIKKQIDLAKKENPDVICVCMHWGIEYQTSPNKEQKELADFLFNNGVDVIIGNHPHVPQPMEKRTITLDDGTTKDGFVIYSLGNFMSNQNKKYTSDSAILNIEITKHVDSGKISIDSATYTPIYMYKDSSKKTKKFKMLDIEKNIKTYELGTNKIIGKSTYNTLASELKNIKKIIGDEIK